MTTPIQIVWFKRDLRVTDHAPLAMAAKAGAVLPIFAWEPSVWQPSFWQATSGANDYAKQHQVFVTECLKTLRADLTLLGLHLLESPHGIINALNEIRSKVPIANIFSSEETGNDATFTVDKSVASWCKTHGVNWVEIPQNGVVRALQNRNHWNAHWEKRMAAAQFQTPTTIISIKDSTLDLPVDKSHFNVHGKDKPQRQQGGRNNAMAMLTSFLEGRAARYRGGISSPINAVTAGSRLSPYLAWGVISMREVVQATRLQQLNIAEAPQHYPRSLSAGLRGFESRLHWHCHFMQKLESEPAIEFNNMHRAHDGMRDELISSTESQLRLAAWTTGETGWPLVDACMAMLRETGWINFRMRAMLMSTASYLFWLHWRAPGLHLAREFLDYEPGIHWPQAQMQAGTTGINTLRIYNPVKQAMDQDAEGKFVRHWLPALKNVPNDWIFNPWLMPDNLQIKYGCKIGRDYPAPLVTIEQAAREAKAHISAARKSPLMQTETAAVIKKHASRKGMQGSNRDVNGKEISMNKRKKTNAIIAPKLQQELF